MASQILAGTAAGAVGTVALDMATYADMLLRGRPSSGTPAKLAGVLADKVGVDLATGEGDEAKKTEESRQSGLVARQLSIDG